MTADLPESTYAFPHHITPTNLCPDIVWWSDTLKTLWSLELTVSFETNMDQAHEHKLSKYQDLLEEGTRAGYHTKCLAFEVGSRGLISKNVLLDLRQALNVSVKAIIKLAVSVSRLAILGSFKVWCTRNTSGD